MEKSVLRNNILYPVVTIQRAAKVIKKRSIGACNSVASLVEKSLAMFAYASKGSHVQQVAIASVIGAVAFLVALPICSAPANAGYLNGFTFPEDKLLDWEFSKKVWTEAKTLDEFNKEDDRYFDIADPWLESLNYSRIKIDEALKNAPDNQETLTKRRGHDMQLLYEIWNDSVYRKWQKRYKEGETSKTFTSFLTDGRDADKACFNSRRIFYTLCVAPDWRTPEMIKTEKAMMKKAKGLFEQKNKVRKAQEKMFKNLRNR